MDALQMKKIIEAAEILKALGMDKSQYNERSCLVLLALSNIKPTDDWDKITIPLLTTVQIMQFMRDYYNKDYKPNSRETIRRQTLHQFEQGMIIERNRDNPERATNSKDNNYSLNEPIRDILKNYPDNNWQKMIEKYKKDVPNLKKQFEKKLDMVKIDVNLLDGTKIKLSPGKHNQLHADIIHEFAPRFISKNAKVLYIGDTASSRKEGGKLLYLDSVYFNKIGIPPLAHDKLPDVVIIDEEKGWLFLIEAVTSHGPVSTKRWIELEVAFKDCKVGRVYVTAFPDQAEFRKNAADIAWETEVWIANNPDHMIHFNGDRFLGPHK
jgi:adenine-specific DNA-methyltransferase